MPLEQLLQKILMDAEADAARLKREAVRERDAILGRAEADAEAAAEKIAHDAEREAKLIVDRAKAGGELEARKLLLATKQEMIRQAIEEAVRTLAEMPDETYRETLARMMVRAAASLGGGEIEVIVSTEDRARVAPDFLRGLGQDDQLPDGTSFRLSSESRPTGGGFVLRKGKIESNGTFPALAKAGRDGLEALAAALLFGDA
jgi:V/A-type H+-transporting ATPase subunit E